MRNFVPFFIMLAFAVSCAPKTPNHQSGEAYTDGQPSLCTPGSAFDIESASYLVIKAPGQQDQTFERLGYKCRENEGIDFFALQGVKRNATEVCRNLKPSGTSEPVLFFPVQDRVPAVFTRLSMRESIVRVFAHMPCHQQKQVDLTAQK